MGLVKDASHEKHQLHTNDAIKLKIVSGTTELTVAAKIVSGTTATTVAATTTTTKTVKTTTNLFSKVMTQL